MIAAAVRRFLLLLGGVAGLTLACAVPVGLLTGDVSRAVATAFYLVGAFMLVVAFFIGNRGPVRLNDGEAKGTIGSSRFYWAGPSEREATLNSSALFVVLGILLIACGVLADSRYPLL
jgi:hypothetical protein